MHPDALFVEASKLTDRKEDLFTLAVAACLGEEQALLRQFTRRILGRNLYQSSCTGRQLGVRTQVGHNSPRCVFDMVVYADERPVLVLEHKLLSPEGKSQLEKYLSTPRSIVPRVAYIAGYYANSLSVAGHARYVRHGSGRLHFVWSDFYDLFAGADGGSSHQPTGLRRAVKALFDRNLFQPSHWAVAGLKDEDPIRRDKADKRVAALVLPTRSALERMPFDYTTASSWSTASEFYATDGRSSRLAEIRLAPGVVPGALKLVFKCTSVTKAQDVRTRVERGMSARARRSSIIEYRHLGYSGRGVPHAIEILTPWSTIFGSAAERGRMAAALKRYVIGLATAAC